MYACVNCDVAKRACTYIEVYLRSDGFGGGSQVHTIF
jgi:hypothetical protein